MLQKVVLYICLCLFMIGCNANSDNLKTEIKLVENSFSVYKDAILSSDGPSSTKFVSSKTFAYYSQMRDLALNSTKLELEQKNLLDRMIVLRLRAEFNGDKLNDMTGKGIFVYAVNNHWIGDEVKSLQIRDIKITGDRANSKISQNGQSSPIGFTFYNEEGSWKIDLTSIFLASNSAFVKNAKDAGMTENQMLDYVFRALGYEKGLSDDLWLPLNPS